MKLKRNFLFTLLLVLMLSEIANATTIFARQYDMKCHACHVGVPPTLNNTGNEFLRNGMRFSANEMTTLQRALSSDENLVPVGFFLGGTYKSMEREMITPRGTRQDEKDVTNPILSLFVSGSLSKNFSTFIGARFGYVEPSPMDTQREFKLLKRKAYLQYNQGPTHLARAGVLYPYPETSENSGLSDIPDLYISPLDRAYIKPIYGVEYSYLLGDGFSVLVAGGEVGNANSERNIMAGVNYSAESFTLAAILSNITATQSEAEMVRYTPSERILGERVSLMAPFEYQFEYGNLNMTGLYEKNELVQIDDYYGLETLFTAPVFESGNIRLIYTTDNSSDKGYAFKYAQVIYDNLFINTNIAKVETDKASFTSVSFGANIIY